MYEPVYELLKAKNCPVDSVSLAISIVPGM